MFKMMKINDATTEICVINFSELCDAEIRT